MPQQLSLYSTLSNADLIITLHTLSSLTGMSPFPLLEHSLIWEPKHPYKPVLLAGQVNQIEQYRIILTNDMVKIPVKVADRMQQKPNEKENNDDPMDLDPSSNERENSTTFNFSALTKRRREKFDTILDSQNYVNINFEELALKSLVLSYTDTTPISKHELKLREWNFNIYEQPEGGKRTVISQSILSSSPEPNENWDPFEFIDKLGYVYKNEYWVKGYQFIYGNIVLRIFRLCRYASPNTKEAIITNSKSQVNQNLDNEHTLVLLDPSQRWTVKAYIDVGSITDLDGINKATQELEALKNGLVGLLDLELPDRKCFDSRMRWK